MRRSDMGFMRGFVAVLAMIWLGVLSGEIHAAIAINSATLNGASTVTVAPGASIAVNISVTTSGSGTSNNWESTGWRISTTAPGTLACDTTPAYGNSGTNNTSFNITAPATAGTYNVYFVAYNSTDCSSGASATHTLSSAVIVVVPPPSVVSINRASFDPTAANTAVSWTVIFDQSVTGVDAADFALVQAGGVVGAAITSVSGSGTIWTVNANTGTGKTGTLRLDLVDNDSIMAGALPLGGVGNGNGNFTGQFYTLLQSVCTGAADIVFCDDFERSNPGSVGNGWTVTPASVTNCTGAVGNTGCAGIDSDIPPYTTYSNPRPNPTRALFTRWSIVSVDSPAINLAGKSGGQLSFWMRRGHDSFSECPEATGENYLVQYFASDGTWKILAQYPSSPSAALCDGAIYTPTIELPADALHANLKFRFYQPGGSGKSGSGGAPGVVGYDYWHMDDVVVRAKDAPSYTGAFCDNFEAGLARWSITAEGVPTGANIGDARIGSLAYQSASHELDLRWGYVLASTFKTDMTGVSGNITYWLRSGTTTATDPITNENLAVEYLNSSGVWSSLATYLGSAAAGTVYAGNHVLPADAKHANFRLRFRELAGSGYDKSYWHIDDVCVGDLLPTADLALVKTGGTLVPGSNTTYTLKVTNNGPGTLSGSMQIVDTLPSGLSYLAGSGTGWVCGAVGQVVTCSWTGTLVNGAVAPDLVLTVAVGAGVTGSVTNTASVSGTVNDNVPGNNTASFTSGNFVPSYVFTDKPCVNGIAIGQPGQVCSLISWSPQIAGQDKSGIYITAVNGSGVPTQLSASASSTIGFQFALSCHDPVANAGVQATFTAASPSTLPLCAANGATPSTWSTTTNLTFAAGSPSVASGFTFNYADVGEIELFMRNAAATSQIGTSGTFVVKPAGFVLTEIKPTANPAGRCADSTTPPPAVTCASVAADAATFVRAGEDFSATVKALTATGAVAPNFGKEIVPESIKLIPTNMVAGMVTPPDVLGDFAAFSAGTATGTAFTWEEVGIVTLTPMIKDGDYLGAGDVTGTTSGNIGRFIPDHFDTEVTQSCASGGFSYAGQPFTVKATAKSVSGNITQNYNAATGFSRAVTLSAWNSAGAVANPGPGSLLPAQPPAIIAASDFTVANKGVAQVNTPSYVFTNRQTPPTTVRIRATDSDAASSATGSEGTAAIRSGRASLSNAHGSELLDLPVPFYVEYWNGSWVRNLDDTCTSGITLALADVTAADGLVPGETCVLDSGSPGLSGIGCAAAGVAPKRFVSPPSAADFRLWLKAPGLGNSGALNLTATVPTWLQFNWKGTGDTNPSARVTFGVNAAKKSPIIYMRENY